MNGIRDTSALVRAAFAVVTAVGAVHIAQSSFQIFRLALRIGPKAAITKLIKDTRSAILSHIVAIGPVKMQVAKELNAALDDMEQSLVKKVADAPVFRKLPENGVSADELITELDKLSKMNGAEWQKGRVSGVVYHGGEELNNVISTAFTKFELANPLHPEVFPAVRKMEAEIVSMVLSLFHGPEGSCGVTTSGGTESIIMACKAYKTRAYRELGIVYPEMIIPKTAHVAFDKAAEYFNINVHHSDFDLETGKVNVDQVENLINGNTIMIVGSAPNYPHGIVDNIEKLSEIAVKYDIPLHVDCCLGSFLMPFVSELGFMDQKFDFQLPGVTSISCDTHKYGFAPKGSSVLMYRSRHLRAHQFFVTTTWPGGIYASPSMPGSRPGSLLAGCWAAMLFMGINGYRKSCKDIVSAIGKIKSAVKNEMPELKVIGDPLVCCISFTSDQINIYSVGDEMSRRGWKLNALQDPPGFHLAATRLTIDAADDFILDLMESIVHVKKEGKGAADGNMAALYGTGILQDTSIISDLATGFIELLYKA